MIITITRYRSSITGRFIKKADALKYPMTTQKHISRVKIS